MNHRHRIQTLQEEVFRLENEFKSLKVLSIQSNAYPTKEEIQLLTANIQEIYSKELALKQELQFLIQTQSCISRARALTESLNIFCTYWYFPISTTEIQTKSETIALLENQTADNISTISSLSVHEQEKRLFISKESEKLSEIQKILESQNSKIQSFAQIKNKTQETHSALAEEYAELADSENKKLNILYSKTAEVERLAAVTESLVDEKFKLQKEINRLKSAKQLVSYEQVNRMVLQQNDTENCAVCHYPRAGRVKICKQCNFPVHLKCMSNSLCFVCNSSNN